MWDFSEPFVTFDLPFFFWDGSGDFEVATGRIGVSLDGMPIIGIDPSRIELGGHS